MSTGGMVDAVGDSGGDADEADLADSLGSERRERVWFSDEDDVDARSVGVDGDEVVTEGGVGDAPVLGSTMFSSNRAWPMPPVVPPMIWLRAVFSLRMRPASTAVVMRGTRMRPRSSSTRTSTSLAANGPELASSTSLLGGVASESAVSSSRP